MEKIASFCIDHEKLLPGLYVSRKDRRDGVIVTTFDLRFVAPNREPVVGATFLRNGERKDDVVYFGPMGCRTGFYLLMFGDLTAKDVLPLVEDMCRFVLGFEGEIPGAKPSECGNWSEQNLAMAKFYVARYLDSLEKHARTEYPKT